MVFDAPHPKNLPVSFCLFKIINQNVKPCVQTLEYYKKNMLFGQCHSTLSFCYENTSPNTSYYDGKYTPVRNFPVFC